MKRIVMLGGTLLLWVAVSSAWGQSDGGLPDIQSVKIGANRQFVVNDQPFLPIMGWLQGPAQLPKLKAIGCNAIAGYWRPADGGAGAGGGADGYMKIARDAGLYFVAPFEPKYAKEMATLRDSASVLAWIHSDEPDMPRTISDADVTPGAGLVVNASRPMRTLVDGDAKTSAILDPMAGASLTVKLKKPVTVKSLAVTNFISGSMPVAKKITFTADGKPLVTADLERIKTAQKINLPAPATFTTLGVEVTELYSDENSSKWGAIAEVEAFDADGVNVLKSVPRKVTRESAEEVMHRYQQLKAFDKSRPICMTVTCFFIDDSRFDHWWPTAEADKLYPPLLKATDVMGFDVYPIYGWNQPEKIDWVSQGVNELRHKYGSPDKPVYVWIETVFGGNFGDRAHPVTGLEIRNEVYQAIIRGATAIGYFTHQFKPSFSEFAVPPENQKAIGAINQQLTRLAPVILDADSADQPTITIAGDLNAQLLAKSHDGWTYVFAQNMDMKRRGGEATITVKALPAGKMIEVVDEQRTIKSQAGSFTDQFDPLAVHIYRWK